MQDRIDAVPTAADWAELLDVHEEQERYVKQCVVIDDAEAKTLQANDDAPAQVRPRMQRALESIDEEGEFEGGFEASKGEEGEEPNPPAAVARPNADTRPNPPAAATPAVRNRQAPLLAAPLVPAGMHPAILAMLQQGA